LTVDPAAGDGGAPYSVWTWFPDDFHHQEGNGLDLKAAVELAAHLARRPAASIGIIKRVTVVDCDDNTALVWEFGKGITFPTQESS
jgi:hypothetical protein